MNHPPQLDELVAAAQEMGARRAEVVPTGILTVKTAAWAKCFIPACKFYGSSIMCPPHNPLKPEITRRIVGEYQWGVLFQLMAEVEDFVGDQWRTRHVPTELKHKEMVAELEGRAFAMGYPLAMGFAAGECSLCVPRQECTVLAGDECRHPLRARPAMEACGFDVFTIMKTMGWPMAPIGHRCRAEQVPCASLVGLVLVV
ncbi:MAG: DUF2284 domain-containing protein [Proteobacteria bacterium]|nr:DUF2284 domain-containing protein [Pseudomonadota bacterium]MBU1449519.1 DUF2284 domain-containing protein [Pseudomonadota bacterium]MBU2468695.1 DUF2284 domain-containing protein [Pseudomonadota bacterium]MBU2516086.1 DUF2284 domain-containing protein [Pseudomonadota bacterium]